MASQANKGYEGTEARKRKRAAMPKPIKVPIARPATEMRIVNYVCAASFACTTPKYPQLPLRILSDELRGHYVANGFQCVTAHMRSPKVSLHVFGTYEIIGCGGKHEGEVLLCMYRVMAVLRDRLGIHTRLIGYDHRNVVASIRTGFLINLNLFYEDYQMESQYEPDLYPGLQYYPNWPSKSLCVIMHHTGAINVVGSDGLMQAETVYATLRIERYRLNAEYRALESQYVRDRGSVVSLIGMENAK